MGALVKRGWNCETKWIRKSFASDEASLKLKSIAVAAELEETLEDSLKDQTTPDSSKPTQHSFSKEEEDKEIRPEEEEVSQHSQQLVL